MSTKMKWVIALFVLQLVAWIGIGISSGMAAIGSIAAAFGMSAFGIAGFVVWHYESMDKLKKQYENKEKRAIGFVEEKENDIIFDEKDDVRQKKQRGEETEDKIQLIVALILCGIFALGSLIGIVFSVINGFTLIPFIICLVLFVSFVTIPIVFYLKSLNDTDENQ